MVYNNYPLGKKMANVLSTLKQLGPFFILPVVRRGGGGAGGVDWRNLIWGCVELWIKYSVKLNNSYS